MTKPNPPRKNLRILLVDDNVTIHEDYRKILAPEDPPEKLLLDDCETLIFSDGMPSVSARRPAPMPSLPRFELESAYSGEEAFEKVRQASQAGRPYALAFVDVRMPPGWDGIETTVRLWGVDPELQVVICTAYSDYSWDKTLSRLERSDSFLVLKKPFDAIEVLQLANALTLKWHLASQVKAQVDRLESMLPICCYCKRIRQDENYWRQVEAYFHEHAGTRFSHSICPECYERQIIPQLDAAEKERDLEHPLGT
jgi:CheY-like chemotaxis protein